MTRRRLTAGENLGGADLSLEYEQLSSVESAICMVVDDERRIVFANRAYKEFLGIDPQQVLGRRITDLEPISRCDQVLRNRSPLLLHVCHLHSLGNLEVIGNIVPLKEGDQPIAAVAVFLPTSRLLVAKAPPRFPDNSNANACEALIPQHRDITGMLLPSGHQLICASSLLRDTLNRAFKVSQSPCSVLLTGESGVGKELVAEFIHYSSDRKDHPLIKVNCAAIPDSLLESELFGYAPGAFTGASRQGKAGKFELANHGTIFLDEIEEMSPAMQAKILRVIEDKKVDRVGGTHPMQVDVRIIAATNCDLKQLVQEKRFREDLYFRLKVFPITVPPLRMRQADIPPLIEHFATELVGPDLPRPLCTERTLRAFTSYHWPGNARELKNAVQYALVLNEKNTIDVEHLPVEVTGDQYFSEVRDFVHIKLGRPLEEMQQELEKKALVMALHASNQNKSRASAMLGITRRTLYLKAREFGLLS